MKNQGLSSAQSYPYKNKRGKCQNFKSIGSILSVSKANLYGDENRLKRIVANNGPVAGFYRIACIANVRNLNY